MQAIKLNGYILLKVALSFVLINGPCRDHGETGYETVISSSESEKSECLLERDGDDRLDVTLQGRSRAAGELQKSGALTLSNASSSSSSSSEDFFPTSLRSGLGLVFVGRVCSLQPPEDNSSLSFEFLHFIRRFWNHILT